MTVPMDEALLRSLTPGVLAVAGRRGGPDAGAPAAGRDRPRGAGGGVAGAAPPPGARHEAGSPNVIGVYSIASACK
ncbi:hypothetical protein ACFU8I_38080, partial [Streptomyces sp. NPDC057540]